MWANLRSLTLDRQREMRYGSWRRRWVTPGKGAFLFATVFHFRDSTPGWSAESHDHTAAQDTGSLQELCRWPVGEVTPDRSWEGAECRSTQLSCYPCQQQLQAHSSRPPLCSDCKVTDCNRALVNCQYLCQIIWEATGRNGLVRR